MFLCFVFLSNKYLRVAFLDSIACLTALLFAYILMLRAY